LNFQSAEQGPAQPWKFRIPERHASDDPPDPKRSNGPNIRTKYQSIIYLQSYLNRGLFLRDNCARLRPDPFPLRRSSLQISSPHRKVLLNYRQFSLFLRTTDCWLCRLSAIPRKPLILNPFQASRLSSFLPTLAHPSAKSFPCVSYGNIGGWGSGPTNSSQAHRPYSSISWASLPSSTSHQSAITSHAFFSSQFVGCASTPPCGTLVLLYLLQPNPSRG
jgi:hypothetical protein